MFYPLLKQVLYQPKHITINKSSTTTIEIIIYANNGVPSPLGGKAHGGEMHAVKKHLNSMPIDQQVYDSIAQQTNSILRISAMTLRVQGMVLLCINAYFYDSIGFKYFPIKKSCNRYIC